MARMNVVGALRSYLEDGLGGVEVRVSVPDPRPRELVTVTRNGGGRAGPLLDRAGVDVLCWAPTEARASELSAEVSDLMLALNHGHILDGYDRVEEEAVRSEPDRDSGTPRWFSSYTVTTHAYDK